MRRGFCPWQHSPLRLVFAGGDFAVDMRLEDVRWLEDHHVPRIDRHFDARLGISADALALATDDEGTEGRQLYRLARGKRITDLGEHALDKFGRFGARKADLLVDRLTQISPRHCFTCHHRSPAFSFEIVIET